MPIGAIFREGGSFKLIPDPVLFSWGPFTVRWYGVLIVLGMVIAVILGLRETRRRALSEDHLLNMAMVALPAGVVGARLYYVAFNWSYFQAHPTKIIATWEGGLAIHGGLIVGALVFMIMARRYRFGVTNILDIAAPSVALAQSIGRWGNYINQEAYGYVVSKAEVPWAMMIDGAYRHPTFLYESVWDLLLFGFLLWFRRRRRVLPGDTALMYVLLYSAGRVVIEGFRTDSLMLGSWRVAQLVSVAGILFALIALWYRHDRENKMGGRIDSVR